MTNVLFLMVDEMAWWALGHVTPSIHTPNIDRLAARSRRFTQAYTPSPICVPTRAAIAPGRDVHEIGYWCSAEPYDGRVPSWGHALQAVDVPVVSIGKLHYRSPRDDVGFDEQIEPLHVVAEEGWVQALLRRPVALNLTPESLAEEIGTGVSDDHRFDERVTDAACSWLADRARRARPWCAFVSWLAPHFPLLAPQGFFDLCDPRAFEGGAAQVPDHPVLSAYRDGGSSVGITILRWDHWKLVHCAEGFPPQIFDLTSDPGEAHDLAATRPDVLDTGLAMLHQRLDPEAVDAQAHADQARRVAALGGRQAVLDRGQFDYTPIT